MEKDIPLWKLKQEACEYIAKCDAERGMKKYKEIVKVYKQVCKEYQLSDEYLRESKCKTRDTIPIAAEFQYGVVYLQDDAVDVLLERIYELERLLQEARHD